MENVKLNIIPNGKKSICYVSQNDNGRYIRFNLFSDLIPYKLSGSETISVKVVRPDGAEIVKPVTNTEDYYVDVVFYEDMTAIAGVGNCEIKITDGETVLGSRNFDINIEVDAYDGKDIVIETATGALAEFNTDIEDNALEYESEIPYKADGYTGLRVINTRTAPVYDKTPYLFRKTPSGYGNSCIEKLNGLTVAFNQLSPIPDTPQGVTGLVTDNRDGSWTFNGTAATTNYIWIYTRTAIPSFVKPNHCYYCASSFKEGLYQKARLQFILYGSSNTFVDTEDTSKIFKAPSDFSQYTDFGFVIQYITGSVFTNDVLTPQLIDLTQMFGSTIADYLYNLETQTAGAGVSVFKSLFGADYYAYNAGELMSVKTSGRKTVGKNLVPHFREDERTYNGITVTPQANGSIRLHGTSTGQSNYLVSMVDYVKELPAGTYTFNIGNYQNYVYAQIVASGHTLYSYQAKDTYAYNNGLSISRLDIGITAGAYNAPIDITIYPQLEFGSQATAYEPYSEITYPLDPDLELRGIPKLDANNKLYGDGDIYESSGDVTRRYGIVDLGSLNWGAGFGGFYSAALVGDIKLVESSVTPNMICGKKYKTINYTNKTDKTVSIVWGGADNPYNSYLNILDSDYSDAATFKTSLDGVYLIYEKATPTSESADPYTDPQEARITEEFIDNRAIPIPVGQDSIYGTDIEYQDIDFDTTIYGGEIDAVNGVLSSEYNSDGSLKPTPDIISITPANIPVKAGDNKIFNSANGDQTIRYYNQVE